MKNVATNKHIFQEGRKSMVSSIQGISQTMGMNPMFSAQSLTDEQKQKVADILSEYDPENITEKDAKAIFQAFKDAGITPTKGLKETIEAAGFDAEDLRTKGMPDKGGQMPPPPPEGSSQGVNVSALQSLQEILSQYDLSNLSGDDESALLTKLQEQGLMNPGYIIDLKS
jgi:hypothetical protein